MNYGIMGAKTEGGFGYKYLALTIPLLVFSVGNIMMLVAAMSFLGSPGGSFSPVEMVLFCVGELMNLAGSIATIAFIVRNMKHGYSKKWLTVGVLIVLRFLLCEIATLSALGNPHGAWYLIISIGLIQTSGPTGLFVMFIDKAYKKKVSSRYVDYTVSSRLRTFDQNNVHEIVNALNAGGIVAVPTETVYGLAIKWDNEEAIEKLTRLKDRGEDKDKIFTLMIAKVEYISKYVEVDAVAWDIIQKYLPGELTLVLPRKQDFSHPYFEKFSKIGIRIPKHRFMLDLLYEAGPLIVTSANLRGEEPANTSVEANKLPVDAVVVGESGQHPASTVAEVVDGKIVILRQGGLVVE
jgi:Sua5/YciO/YrdC/YwlC family protein